MIPYCYLLGWTSHNKWYYGVRYAGNCQPSDLWSTYFTSSKTVKEWVKEIGDPDLIQIRKTFTDISSARKWETKVLKRMKVVSSLKWLNKTDNISIAPMYGENNPATRPEVKKLISQNTPKKFGDENPMRNPETARKAGQKLKGRINYWQIGEKNPAKRPEVRNKLSRPGKTNPFYGKEHSTEFKQNMSVKFKGVPKEKIVCPHCGKLGGKNTMGRWHFDNCKDKPRIDSRIDIL